MKEKILRIQIKWVESNEVLNFILQLRQHKVDTLFYSKKTMIITKSWLYRFEIQVNSVIFHKIWPRV